MKKFALVFAAFIFTGDFKQTVAAAETYSPGSAKAAGFDEDQQVDSTTFSFTNVDGKKVTITTGDGFRAVTNADGTFKGFKEATAAEIASWTDQGTDADPAVAPASAEGKSSSEESQGGQAGAGEESNAGAGA